jgi:hypothetical protein
MDKEYEDLQFAENEFFRAYSLALKAVGSNKGTSSSLIERLDDTSSKERHLYSRHS